MGDGEADLSEVDGHSLIIKNLTAESTISELANRIIEHKKGQVIDNMVLVAHGVNITSPNFSKKLKEYNI